MNKVDYQLLLLDTNEREGYEFQKRRHDHWRENQELYRDKVITNRITQRQSVNVPLMKGTIRTIQANTDEFPSVEFEDQGNNKDKELFFNAFYQQVVEDDKWELKDVLDKKQEFLYGRTWTRFNIRNGKFCSEVLEPYDILIDRNVDPTDIETANYLIHMNMFRTIGQLEANPNYNKDAITRLKLQIGLKSCLIKADQVTPQLQHKNERMRDMGVTDINSPVLGETLVELKHHYVKVYDSTDKQHHWHVVVKVQGEILMAKPLMEILNIDFLPFVTWADDIERNDFYSDGIADIVRTPNKLLNAWMSQLTENRTLRNFGMNFYDATANENWVPQSFEAQPFGWYPLPGKPSDVFQKVEIPDLSESIDEMQYVKGLVESASAATASTKGDTEKGKVTLGEIELTVQAAKERMGSIAKFYGLAQKEKADKFQKMVNANPDKLTAVKLYKKSHKGNWFKKTVSPSEWASNEGYTCRVVSSSERESKSLETIQKLKAIKMDFNPANIPLNKIVQKRELEFAKLNPDEMKEVMDFEEQAMQQAPPEMGMPGVPPTAGPEQLMPDMPAQGAPQYAPMAQ